MKLTRIMSLNPDFQEAVFLKRPNRFLAEVAIQGKVMLVHVPNTGRCRELLIPGVPVLLEEGKGKGRKTPYSLHYVKNRGVWVNIHSVRANDAAWMALRQGRIREIPEPMEIRREVIHGSSRIDLYCQSLGQEVYIEVKGVTLLEKETLVFPDAPTLRGVRHLQELSQLAEEGKRAIVLFVGQHPLGTSFRPNWDGDPLFSRTLGEAVGRGVEVLCYAASPETGSYNLTGGALPYKLMEDSDHE